ncbi:hypothetical protein ISN44_As08g008010 [Arabidopsis suecica]|uniref:Uncharacterized protein n=1 Tax=Arabidopsis suecica TaxID=45249 RepID=A0A8T2B676_ARASU|nr:hypothetical protein ISN44_As08g008010 [Arabidopsis suecica]
MSRLRHLRSVTALASRGGRGLPSRPTSAVSKDVDETKVLVEVRNMKKQLLVLWGYLSCGSMGYLAWESIQLHNALEQARQVKKKKKQDLKN